MEQVILVDERDRALGVEEKLRAHRDGGMLHRAFSIFIRDPAGRVLLQLRSRRKYHFGGLWTNACCGHPRPGEATDRAAHRRLREELGFDVPLSEVSAFVYRGRPGEQPDRARIRSHFPRRIRRDAPARPRRSRRVQVDGAVRDRPRPRPSPRAVFSLVPPGVRRGVGTVPDCPRPDASNESTFRPTARGRRAV